MRARRFIHTIRDTTIRDTSLTGVSDSAKWSQTKSGATEIKPGVHGFAPHQD